MRAVIGVGLMCAVITWGTVCVAEGTAPAPEKSRIVVMGATTVAALIEPWVTEYQQKHPEDVVVVHANLHSAGFKAFLDKTVDVAMLARALNDSERRQAAEKGVRLEEGFLDYDAIAIVVNPGNPVSELSLEQLRGIFRGELDNWKQVGGLDEPIEVVTVPPESGMRSFLTESLFDGEITRSASQVRTVRQSTKLVEARKGAITYCRTQLALNQVAKEGRLKALALKVRHYSPAIPLTEQTVRNGTFPILRKLALCYDADRASQAVKAFVDYCCARAKEATPIDVE